MHKAVGLDIINARLPKECTTEIIPTLALIFNESLASVIYQMTGYIHMLPQSL